MIALLVLLVVSFIQFPWGHGSFWNVRPATNVADYPSSKLTRLMLFVVPMVFLATLVNPAARERRFLDGLRLGVSALGLLTAAMIFINADAFATHPWDVGASVIDFSLILTLMTAAVASWLLEHPTGRRKFLFISAISMALAGCFLVAQRTALVLIVAIVMLVWAKLVVNGRSLLVISTLGWTLFLVAVALPLFGFSDTDYSATFVVPSERVASLFSGADGSSLTRSKMWSFVLMESIRNPVGHGFGSFATDYDGYMLYPHNAVLEALYELGFLGFMAIGCLVVLSIRITRAASRVDLVFYQVAVVVGMVFAMKAGDLPTISPWLSFLILAVGATRPGVDPV